MTAARFAVAALLAGAAGWAFHRVFDARALVLVVAVAATVPVLVAALLRSRPLWLALLAGLPLWCAGAALAVYGTVAPAVLARIPADLANSWQALLGTLLPAPAEPRLLILVYTLVWLAAVTGAELVGRSRTRAAPALPAIIVFGIAVLLGVGGTGSNLPVAAVLLALTALLSLLGDRLPALWLAAGVPAVGALAALAMLAGPLLPLAREPYDPRADAVPPQPVRFDAVSPLDRISAWLRRPETELFTVRSRTPLNWRLAVLDRYDGVRWTSSARFVPTGGRVPPGERTGKAYDVEQTVTVKALRDRWLPAAERPTWVSGLTGVVTDPDSGALVAGAKTSQGLTYRVTSRIEQPTKEELRAATPSGDAALLHVPAGRYEQEFRRLAQQATRGATLPYRQAEMLEEFLRGSARYDITAPPGHSLPSLDFFLRETRRGTSEQFAATFALMARTLGLPTRVVVGFRPGTQEGGVYKVTTGDVIAWAEVRFAGLGWLAFDPTPPRSGEQSRHDVPSAVEKERRRLDQELGEVTADKPRPSTKPTRRPDSAPEEAGLPGWALAVLAVAALALAYVALALLLPWWRRRARRNAGDAGLRVAGAWRQTCDDLGLTGEDALTAQEVVRHGDETHGADVAAHLAPLADITNFARYAPDGAGPHDAEEAWRRSDAVHTLLRRRTPPLRRLTRRLHPRTLIPPRPR